VTPADVDTTDQAAVHKKSRVLGRGTSIQSMVSKVLDFTNTSNASLFMRPAKETNGIVVTCVAQIAIPSSHEIHNSSQHPHKWWCWRWRYVDRLVGVPIGGDVGEWSEQSVGGDVGRLVGGVRSDDRSVSTVCWRKRSIHAASNRSEDRLATSDRLAGAPVEYWSALMPT
jgi:hypothetical protein